MKSFSPPIGRQAPHRPTNNPNSSKFAQKAGGSDVCPRCGKTVYAAEKVVGGGNVRKKSCSRNVQSCFKIKVDDDLKHFFHVSSVMA